MEGSALTSSHCSFSRHPSTAQSVYPYLIRACRQVVQNFLLWVQADTQMESLTQSSISSRACRCYGLEFTKKARVLVSAFPSHTSACLPISAKMPSSFRRRCQPCRLPLGSKTSSMETDWSWAEAPQVGPGGPLFYPPCPLQVSGRGWGCRGERGWGMFSFSLEGTACPVSLADC